MTPYFMQYFNEYNFEPKRRRKKEKTDFKMKKRESRFMHYTDACDVYTQHPEYNCNWGAQIVVATFEANKRRGSKRKRKNYKSVYYCVFVAFSRFDEMFLIRYHV